VDALAKTDFRVIKRKKYIKRALKVVAAGFYIVLMLSTYQHL